MAYRILQLTDLHVFSEARTTLKDIPTRESLQDVVAFIRETEAPFDQVIVTGDHTHDELPASYDAVREILAPWSDRLRQVPGNHDDRSVLSQTFPQAPDGDGCDRIQFQYTAGDWLIIGLDTHWPGNVAGQIDDACIEWLQQVLSQSSKTRVALFFHHPPVDVGCEWMDAIGLNGREMLHRVVESDDRIRLICCGHVHHEFRLRLGAADVLTTPSTGIQFHPAGATPSFVAAAPGYRVIEIEGEDFSTHVVRLPEVKYTPSND